MLISEVGKMSHTMKKHISTISPYEVFVSVSSLLANTFQILVVLVIVRIQSPMKHTQTIQLLLLNFLVIIDVIGLQSHDRVVRAMTRRASKQQMKATGLIG